ncbi:prepilin-type N-terminal cleavage/methylation domain-containing protein [Pseudomonas sp. PDM14]|uniref:pilus assembly FimT family protein n=1 Tax=Pseudomonas sp. PDM14 TaxID=2769288 RepID=UPI0017819CB9|nr:prepilin-type N-terminal cleavage/methylation domain-containing protein [Pseudomonas sp. PDM14]MBD9483645.1 prepilin-type N-terminal cleavage/methylation domain-containing protein [Pseudomonas sp. PDM14]
MRGFTLVELIMVIVIIGILAVVVGPRFFDRSVFDQRLYYEEALSAVRYGQKLAVASGCPIRAQVNSAGYTLTYASACGAIAAGGAVANPIGGGNYATTNSQGVTVAPALDVTFNSLGAASGAGNTASFASGAFSINVNLATGYIGTTP